MDISSLMFYTVVVFHIRTSNVFKNRKVRLAANFNMILYVIYNLYIGLTVAEKIRKINWMLMIPFVGLAYIGIA
ncbi:hypothetical protein AAEX28_09365 [Lentisphaerota bacterium WC36G]|nr:hypothetical protein LJT99_12205 [Lentisphaerae bacterium WC36]